jgi:hypothetical protein
MIVMMVMMMNDVDDDEHDDITCLIKVLRNSNFHSDNW